MIIQISSGSDYVEDSRFWNSQIKTILYKELLVKTSSGKSFTVRRYPRTTVIMYHWNGRGKKLFKDPHHEADKNIGNMLSYINNRYSLNLSGLEFDSIIHAYNTMKFMQI